MASLTNSGSDALERTLDAEVLRETDNHEVCYELSRCVTWIKAGGFKKVCLQFPDELLADAPAVARALTIRLSQNVYILGDTTYGSCCVDEVAAEHVGADAVIHFGRTCLSPSRRLPILYIFTRIPVDVHKVVSKLCAEVEDSSSKLIFVYDTRCHYIADDLFKELQEKFPHMILSVLLNENISKIACSEEASINENGENHRCNMEENCDTFEDKNSSFIFNGRKIVLPFSDDIKDYSFIFLGPEGPTLTSMMLRFSENTFYCVMPDSATIKTLCGVRSLMSRSARLEMAKDAEIIGVLVGTLGVANYRDIINRLKRLIKNAGKRSYTFVVGKPNEPKLCNIPEVDLFVYVSCPETCIIERHMDPVLYKKLITPWELEVALLDGQDWSLQFESDFRQLLPGGAKHVEMSIEPAEEQVNVSLLTNKTQRLGISEKEEETVDSITGAVVLQNGMVVAELHAGGGGELLKSRTWQGLDASVPAPAPLGHVLEGRHGIASVYKDETKSS
ncbi:2-(3-amino-3-carboxypropyl)histidine synthase subunit 2 isoform X2 [Palaemon carinicauda]|uniref:2-(3-amino-3-carboxypropyl)histidine synthase subunit 2 isoform X2 n=1 Tax=Palaemon carinicauda TaxID=392227 RepID=UPI0035B5EA17